MKRLALLAATSQAILWIRQIRYERRLANRQGRWEREAEREIKDFAEHTNNEVGRFAREVNRALRGTRQ